MISKKIKKPKGINCSRSPSKKNIADDLTEKDIINLMRHDSFTRNGRGAITQNNPKVVK